MSARNEPPKSSPIQELIDFRPGLEIGRETRSFVSLAR